MTRSRQTALHSIVAMTFHRTHSETSTNEVS